MAEPTLKELLAVASEAAYVGGRRALAHFNTGVEVEIKADDSPVTRADREAEQVVRSIIARCYPSHSILGEEAGHSKGDNDYKWIVDPIDGTKSFIHGVPLWGTLVGVEVKGRPSVGVIYLPALDEMLCAADGMGCTWNGRRAEVSRTSEMSEATLLTTNVTAAMARSDAYEKLAARARLSAGWGDCYGYVLVATGRAEIMVDPKMSPWDCAPMLTIMQEAGGHFTTWDGEPTIWGPDAVATNARLNAQVLAITKNEKRR